ncbi:hypothetical protein [Qipengyuania nanhaisediminis]|uniref:hypothetical protein n=1 Tax=Qipengyuania nanhaisediminis TaxID=604088 RepID=UPI0038B32FCA
MKSAPTFLLAFSAPLALVATPAHASVDDYTIAGETNVRIDLQLCSMESQLAVRGDTGTDLDFIVTDARGNLLARDQGGDDYLSLLIEKDSPECETYGLEVSNLGEESNEFVVVLEPVTEASTRVSKHIIQPAQTETYKFKACGTSADLTARGDGDTDLDFIVRNSDGAVVHENDDLTDQTSATLAGLLADCETFEIEVANLGNVYNAMMLVIEPKGAASTPFAGTAPSTSLAASTATSANAGVERVLTVSETSGPGEYRAEANGILRVDLPVCTASRLEVRGDGDTDLDFEIVNASEERVHEDYDLSDVTFATLTPTGACETFVIDVTNLGEVYNAFTIALIDADTPRPVTGAGEYRIRAQGTAKIALRVCSATGISAYGDGDTDLDFDVRAADGAAVHSDYDMTDRTSFTLEPGADCGDYELLVSNLGEVFNLLTIAFGDGAAVPEMPENTADSASAATRAASPAVAVANDTISNDGLNRNIALLNRTGEVLDAIYWSNSATQGWGEDKLGSGTSLAGDQQWNVNVFDGSQACLFDFRAVTASGREIAVTRIDACAETSVLFE